MKTLRNIQVLALMLSILILQSCVTKNPACVRAHKNIKKLHLDNWI